MNENLKQQEMEQVRKDLEVNGYNRKFVHMVENNFQRTPPSQQEPISHAILPYGQGI